MRLFPERNDKKNICLQNHQAIQPKWPFRWPSEMLWKILTKCQQLVYQVLEFAVNPDLTQLQKFAPRRYLLLSATLLALCFLGELNGSPIQKQTVVSQSCPERATLVRCRGRRSKTWGGFTISSSRAYAGPSINSFKNSSPWSQKILDKGPIMSSWRAVVSDNHSAILPGIVPG